ncbi:MAG: Zn-dependent hydrolase [Burkholderiaceae bacterium]
MKQLSINAARLRALLDGVNAHGLNPATGGCNRPSFSAADMAARHWLAEQMRADGLTVRLDAAGNVIGRFGPEQGPCIMSGSHLDTVPEGGAFDGLLGVCAALESVRAMQDAGLVPARAIEVVATAEEEGRYGGMLGSQTIAGQIPAGWLAGAVSASGELLTDAMRAQGLDPTKLAASARRADEVTAFVELHIEQGPVLEAEGIPIGLVEGISGISSLAVRFMGKANHSGTTPMHLRADAFAGLAQVAVAIDAIIEQFGGPQSRITIGQVNLQPNFAHTIPGQADFTVIIRDSTEASLHQLRDAIADTVRSAAAAHRLDATIEEQSWLAPIELDQSLRQVVQQQATALGLATMPMPSGAGHDAQTMQSLCPSALIFVPSRDGVSHSPREWTDWRYLEQGANLLLATLRQLSGAGE